MVDIETNPLYYAAAGGLILGVSISLHYVLKGSVTGMSGIVFGIASLNKGIVLDVWVGEIFNKMAIFAGMILAGGIFFDIFRYDTSNSFTPFGPMEDIDQHTSFLGFALAGLLVGFGTKLGNGCTSGHGLCGLSRLSVRSLVAVITFLMTAIAIGTLNYYVTLGPFTDESMRPKIWYNHLISANLCIVLSVILFILCVIGERKYNKVQEEWGTVVRDIGISFLVGFVFGCGLLVAGMCRRTNILQFLWLGKDWNPSLLFVLGVGVIVGLISFNYMIRVREKPLYADKLFNPSKGVDWKLMVGAASFGLGWGIGGLCPGPAMVLFAIWTVPIHVFWFSFLLMGMFLAHQLDKYTQDNTPVSESKIHINNEHPEYQASNEASIENLNNSPEIKKDKAQQTEQNGMKKVPTKKLLPPIEVHPIEDIQ